MVHGMAMDGAWLIDGALHEQWMVHCCALDGALHEHGIA
jgi:hypothetical protein